ncbi:MAG: hypothetical protein A3G81_09925 [Betaproteobacteria bacterium RIFCSPLOWO2_12_FULL_65_14]|nr:MAG: hypothetical protein A3G81_09925 [Betaproteobacteria bacterium RIFCSPLOWO2_12_FULL_65_14]
MKLMKRLCCLFPVVLLVALGPGNVIAQSYPIRPVRLVVPFAPGGGVDVVSRLIAAKLAETLKQPVLIENRGGSGGTVGANVVAKAEPDGYTFLMTSASIAIAPSIYRKLPFDALKDFAPVSQIYSLSLILLVNANVSATSVGALIALAKSQPGRLNYASTGVGGSPHLAAELFKSMTGTDIVHVPYKGVAPMGAALIANEVQVIFTVPVGIVQYIKSGELRALAVTGNARSHMLPKVPTMVEAGVRDYVLPDWMGMFAPAGTSREIIARLHAQIVRILAIPEIRERLRNIGYDPVGSTPEEFDAKFKEDFATFARVIKETRIPLMD